MNRVPRILIRFFAAGIAAMPLIVAAQTPTPATGPASNGPPPATTKSQASAPGSSGSPAATPPVGSQATPSSSANGQTDTSATSDTTTTPRKTKHRALKKADVPKNGDVPSYPAPAPDGTPTK